MNNYPPNQRTAYLFPGKTPYIKRKTGFYKRKSYTGPYAQLTYGDKHTHPVYPKPEAKCIDMDASGALSITTITPQPIDESGGIAGQMIGLLNLISQGTGVTQRIGSTIAVKSLAYRYEIDLPANPTNQVPTSGRVVLLWDHSPNATATAFTAAFRFANYLSYLDVGSDDRFTVLRNDLYSLSPNGEQTTFKEGYVKINMRASWPSTASPNTIPQTGQLWLAYIGDQATAANQPTISGTFRIRYYDC